MLLFLCKLWPYLAGVLIGWLLCGWLARRLKYYPGPSEKIVEKTITVEKIVEKPVPAPAPVGVRSVDPSASAPDIDLTAARTAGIAIKTTDDFTAIEGIGPKISDLIHADGINSFSELSEVQPNRLQGILDNAGSNYQLANPGTWPDQAMLASHNRWPALKALQDILIGGVYPDPSASAGGDAGSADQSANLARIAELEQQLEAASMGPSIDRDAAKAAGFSPRGDDLENHADFTVVEGIGPKINDLIHAANIHTYGELAATRADQLQQILDDAGQNYRLAKPGTWPAQSGLAASNQWDALKSWQDILDGGEE
ncbi:MAG: hypothetical protein AAF420_04905 [Pseudomonadota bacterium]